VNGDARARVRDKITAVLRSQPVTQNYEVDADAVLDALTDDDLADLLGVGRRRFCGRCTVELTAHPTFSCEGVPGGWQWVGPWQPVEPT
jgi:hypothetical protein